MDNFMTWLNTEIEDLKTTGGNNLFMQGKLSEAIRTREIYKGTNEEVKALMCDKYCKFPEAYTTGKEDDNERLIHERCNNCPLG